MPFGVGAAVRIALPVAISVGVPAKADFVFGGQDDGAQPQPLRRHFFAGVHRGLACDGFGGEIKELFGISLSEGFDSRIEGGYGFADAGGRLAQQPAFIPDRPVDGGGQLALPRPVGGKRKGEIADGGIPYPVPFFLHLGPHPILKQQVLEEGLQLFEGIGPDKTADFPGFPPAVGQLNLQAGQGTLPGDHIRVAEHLPPMHAVFPVDFLERQGGGFDFIHQHPFTGGQDAVCAALHRVGDPLIVDGQGEGDLRLVAVALLPLYAPVDARALSHPLRVGIPVVDVAVPQDEFDQFAHRQPHAAPLLSKTKICSIPCSVYRKSKRMSRKSTKQTFSKKTADALIFRLLSGKLKSNPR